MGTLQLIKIEGDKVTILEETILPDQLGDVTCLCSY